MIYIYYNGQWVVCSLSQCNVLKACLKLSPWTNNFLCVVISPSCPSKIFLNFAWRNSGLVVMVLLLWFQDGLWSFVSLWRWSATHGCYRRLTESLSSLSRHSPKSILMLAVYVLSTLNYLCLEIVYLPPPRVHNYAYIVVGGFLNPDYLSWHYIIHHMGQTKWQQYTNAIDRWRGKRLIQTRSSARANHYNYYMKKDSTHLNMKSKENLTI